MNTQFENSPVPKGRTKKYHEFNSPISMPSTMIVKAKLNMTEPCDSDELEADLLADTIVNVGTIARSVSTGHSGGGVALPSSFGSQIASFLGHGNRIQGDLKTQMESGFDRDFSNVRLHTDNAAAEMSSCISAKAFTYGNDIFFNRGQFNPETRDGQRLIAHELTHVVQGTGKIGRDPEEQVKQEIQEDPKRRWTGDEMFDRMWFNHPSLWHVKPNDPEHDDAKKYTELENTVISIILDHLDGKELDSLLNSQVGDNKVRTIVRKFINKYKKQLRSIIQKNPEDYYSYLGNIVRQVLLYYDDNHFFNKTIDLSTQINGCGTRLTLMMAQSGLKIAGGERFGNYKAKGHSLYNIGEQFPVMSGPKAFIKALDGKKNTKQQDLKPLKTIKLTRENSIRMLELARNFTYTLRTLKSDTKKDIEEKEKKLKVVAELLLDGYVRDQLERVKMEDSTESGTSQPGLIVMTTNIWHDASGHVTLWNGKAAADDLDVRFIEKKGGEQVYRLYNIHDINWETVNLKEDDSQ